MNWKQKILTLVALAAFVVILALRLQGGQGLMLTCWPILRAKPSDYGSWGITNTCAELLTLAVCYTGLLFVLGNGARK